MRHSRFTLRIGLEELVARPALCLCLVHGGIGPLVEGLGIRTVLGKDTDADAGGDLQGVVTHMQRRRDGRQHFFRDVRRIVRAVDLLEQNHEFVTPRRLTVSVSRTQSESR